MIATDISDWIARWASWTPHKTALRFEGREVSYAQLERHVASLASWLSANGVITGEPVAFLGQNCPELLEVLFACARLGAIFAPLSPRMVPAELQVRLAATQPRLLVAEQRLHELALDSAGDLRTEQVKLLPLASEPARTFPAAERRPSSVDLDAETPVLILSTSGTTGSPKGATFTHQNLAFSALNVITAYSLTAADEILTAVPMFHAGGLFIHTLPALCAGATITIHRQFKPGQLLEEIRSQRITLLACVPAMTSQLVSDPGWQAADLSSLRLVVTGSTTVPRRAIEPWQRKGVSVAQGYGMTETCVIAATMPPGSPPETAFTAGKSTIHTHIRVVDPSGRDAAVGKPGEVWFRGPAVMQRYWKNEQATREAFCDGWLRSGDLGLIDADGYLYIVGRLKDTIIIGSSSVHPSDLEAVLHGCAAIKEAAVVARLDDELGEVPVACVVPIPGRQLTPEQVIGLFENRLAAYKHPRDVMFLEALPRNATDKVDRKRLSDMVNTAVALPTTS